MSEKKIGRPRKLRPEPPLPSDIKWIKHLQDMQSGSEQLLAALKHQHPRIIDYLLRNQQAKKEQNK